MVIVTSIIRAMVIGFFRRGSAGRDRGRPDIAGNTTAFVIFGIGLSRGGDRCPNRDEGCGGNDERLLHAASPESNLQRAASDGVPRVRDGFSAQPYDSLYRF